MPPRTVTANSHNHSGANNGGSAKNNSKPNAKGSHDHPRSKRDEHAAEETAPPSGPIIKTQITNTTKASSGKSFLDALRVGASKRSNNNTSAAVEKPTVATAVAKTETVAAVVEPKTVTPEPEVTAVESLAAEVNAASVEETAQQLASEQPVVEQNSATPTPPVQQKEQQQQQPVTLPESDAHFSWANDDDYSFVNQFTQPHREEQVQAGAPAYLVQYPQDVIDAQEKGTRVIFKAPGENQTMASAVAALQKESRELQDSRRVFEEYCKQREAELSEKRAQLSKFERQLQEQSENLQQERAKVLEQQQKLQQQQQQQQQHHQQHHHHHIQQSPVRSAPAPPPAPTQHGPQPAPGYTYSPAMQDNMQWCPPPRPDNWGLGHGPVVPPYEHNRYYQNMNYQPPRGKSFGPRSGDVPPHMGRGNPMRSNPHMQSNFNNRPMGAGELRGPMPDGGVNPMFNQRSQVGYMQTNNFHNQW
ncbi:hypothetical protein C3747_44g112 [Trypanosoma cruzi]|uniref:Uncharacterized protein n=2 Tax=Trypanosoma cruzi TaxID=5693 RepID=Q4E3M6_TRYCC|nr:hypothetical protein, conserved [Trypanosoma cruzi]EAN99393.1 hypothetical protein, conserved [Trypanosoma cruzi]KAF5224037.1 hypothetical protein ECC02_002932 [Trypanosoma cruzi]KAF8302740.1 hypothetical protein TcYC6_0043490 [Trypanosoma cruzi]PWV13306.1 hypothetical protein C3747_44g112 [Trypanosoma cruzi]RNC60600.1 hypothetical protein TcCL_ESM01768 [Trypanosoma cruzi]|eukprot:XP_821244.1 hypothetical protein [Trypanosoma cruzi strain CL Brener]